MEFYNYKRFHETLEYQKPMAVYQNSLAVNDRTYSDSDKKVGFIFPIIDCSELPSR
jgi:putative transposase